MCDWTYAAYALLAAGTAANSEQQRKSASQARTAQREAMNDAAAEKAKAEAEAIQRANAELVASKQRRRGQALITRGQPQEPESVLSSTPPSVKTDQTPLIGRGASTATFTY